MPPEMLQALLHPAAGRIYRKAGTYYEKELQDRGADPKATMQNVLVACKKVEDDCEIFGI